MSDDTIEIVLIFGPDGSLQAGIPGGTTYERARPSLKEFMANLELDKLPVGQISEVEQHVHPEDTLKARTGQHAH